jgi:bifunctional UDP-N-acetylglucosamine pyrophosphorylase / glucosamine-1-phosphate N-acetyltransferase
MGDTCSGSGTVIREASGMTGHGSTAGGTLAIVLAAGEGTRMKSALPKVLHKVAGRSMLGHVLAAVGADARAAVIVGPGREDVVAEALELHPGASIHVQTDRLGTAHAVLQARAAIGAGCGVAIALFADTPLVRPETIKKLADAVKDGAAVAVLAFRAADPAGYGRVLTDASGVLAIREHKDATDDERRTTLCNAGLMALDGGQALPILDAVGNDNVQKEFYLPDAVEIARARGLKVAVVEAPEAEVMGVNDRVQLAAAERIMQDRLREAAMRGGVTMIDPQSVFLCHDTVLGRDVLIEPNVVFGPGVVVHDGAVIHAHSHLEGASVAAMASIGPFARLRPGARIGEKAKIGNFVEVKAAAIGKGAKVSHLSYVGDATVGADANIGAGVITCNYDGYFKYQTVIGEGAFVGSNSSLVAPVSIAAGSYVGSGSVVTRDVPEGALALTRPPQTIKEGWAARFHAAMAAKKAAKGKA